MLLLQQVPAVVVVKLVQLLAVVVVELVLLLVVVVVLALAFCLSCLQANKLNLAVVVVADL